MQYVATVLLTVHFVALYKVFILLVDRVGSSCESSDVVIQIPAEVLVKHCGHEVELFVIIFLHHIRGKKEATCFVTTKRKKMVKMKKEANKNITEKFPEHFSKPLI